MHIVKKNDKKSVSRFATWKELPDMEVMQLTKTGMHINVKGQCRKIFYPFCGGKIYLGEWAQYEQTKTV